MKEGKVLWTTEDRMKPLTPGRRHHASLVFLGLLLTDATEEEAEREARKFEKKKKEKPCRAVEGNR